jgi:polar amino acid transport system substrate-binding protein
MNKMQFLIHIRRRVYIFMSSVIGIHRYFKLGIFLILVCLGCILISVPAVSQTQLPNPIKIGVRTTAYPIGNNVRPDKAGGFCGIFGEQLKQELASKNKQIKVQYIDVEPRYDGLIQGQVDLECGPNSLASNTISTTKDIKFSNPFHQTGVKLLLKNKLAQELISKDKELTDIKIGVVRATNTFNLLENRSDIDEFYNSRDEALNALDNDKIQAFASDALIIWTLLKKGVNHPKKLPRKEYENSGYTIYPEISSEISYLIESPTEQYAIAVKDSAKFATPLLNAINSTLNRREIQQAKEELNKYEQGECVGFWCNSKKILSLAMDVIWELILFLIAIISGLISNILPRDKQKKAAWLITIISLVLCLIMMVFKILIGVV